jgi:hypothetical protein
VATPPHIPLDVRGDLFGRSRAASKREVLEYQRIESVRGGFSLCTKALDVSGLAEVLDADRKASFICLTVRCSTESTQMDEGVDIL